jgi:hypothetical protein
VITPSVSVVTFWTYLDGSGRQGVLAAPVVGARAARGGLVHLSDGRTAAGGGQHDFRHLRTLGVVLVRGQGHGGQDADDRDHDHQFDQGKAFLELTLHESSGL